MMKKILVFEGPNKYFEQYLQRLMDDNEREFSLKDLVKVYDDKKGLKRLLSTSSNENKMIFVARAEEFYSVKDHFIENLLRILLVFQEQGLFEYIIFQNPPKFLLDKLRQLEKEDDDVVVEFEQFNRELITKDKLRSFVAEFSNKIEGQDRVLDEVIGSLFSITNKKNNLPVVLMFYGPPGVGKTETAKLLNTTLGNEELFRQQLSMYKTNEFFNYIFGGEEHSLSFSKDVIRYEGNVLLFDEFNQCPPAVYSAFFQMFDEGEFEDNRYRVNLSNTVIICTANFNSRSEIYNAIGAALYSRFTAFIEFNALSIDAKKNLIIKRYDEVLSELDPEDQAYIESLPILAELLEHAKTFSNTRNINKDVELYIMKPLAHRFIEEVKLVKA